MSVTIFSRYIACRRVGTTITTARAFIRAPTAPIPHLRTISSSSSLSHHHHGQQQQDPNTKSAPLLGVAVARAFSESKNIATATVPFPSIFSEFSLEGRVGLVTGANGGLGLEMALALVEQGANTVYGVDLAPQPSKDFKACQELCQAWGRQLVYRQVDVTDQPSMKALCRDIVDQHGKLNVCVAAAGILAGATCLDYPIEDFQRVMNVNCNGVFITASAAAAEMARLQIPGSIILIASMSGSLTNRDHDWTAYNTSKSAVLQMTRSMACELGPHCIRINSLSPGHIRTPMTEAYLSKYPHLAEKWSQANPLGRLGQVHEVRGVVAWLASDASTFCTGSDILVTGGHHAW